MSTLRKIPVDAAALSPRVATAPRPVAEYTGTGETRTRVEGGQGRNDQGVPLWTLDLLVMTADGMAMLRVKFPSAADPTTSLSVNTPVKVENLTAAVVSGNTYFAADQVSPFQAAKQG